MNKNQMIELCGKAAKGDYDAIEDLLGEGEDLTLESRKVGAVGRWSQMVTIVVKDGEGQFWRYAYDAGLTENQPDEWSGAALRLQRVGRQETEKTITVVTFEPISEAV